MGRKTRQEMSGIFDFFKKKKDPEQRSLFAPSLPPQNLPVLREEKKSPFSILKAKEDQPARAKTQSPGFFSMLSPKKEKQKEAPRETPRAPSTPAIRFPYARDEDQQGKLKDLFQGILKEEPPKKNPNRYVFINPSMPPQAIPLRPYGMPTASSSPVMEWTLPTPSQLAEHFRVKQNLNAMWDEIRAIRATPEFKKDQLIYSWQGLPMMIPLDPVVYQEMYTDFANFYGIPWDVMSIYLSVPGDQQKAAEEALWNNVLSPLNAMVPEAFEILKPPDLSGYFNVSFTEPKGEYWLFYVEPKLDVEVPSGGFGGS